MNFPIYTTNGCHYYKIISPTRVITVLPLKYVMLDDYDGNINVLAFDNYLESLYKTTDIKVIEEVEFNIYKNNTVNYLKNS